MAIAKNIAKRPLPFGFNPKVEARNSRLRRLIAKHKIKPLTKAEARRLCEQAGTTADALTVDALRRTKAAAREA